MDGAEAEDRALVFLQGRGLKLIERNWRCKSGELDLVMHEGDTVVVCEVRSRSREDYGDASETVDARKRGKLIRATSLWQARRPQWAEAPLRFDVVTLDRDGNIAWLQEAFDAGS
jgi:putative endonuclease